jgi:Arc/MetJ-type ribon-helix-helix transcriptional regulator
MQITLSKDIENVIEQQIKRGSYANASEAVSDAVRKTFCAPSDIEQDTPELAHLLREALTSAHTPYKKGDLRRAVEKIRAEHAK